MSKITLDIEADMLLDAINHAVFPFGSDSEDLDDWRNRERLETFREVVIQLSPAIKEPSQFGVVVEAFCEHRTEFQRKPSMFVRWTQTKSEETPWIAGDGTKHSWGDFRHARVVR